MDAALRRLEQKHQADPLNAELTKQYYAGLRRAGIWPPKIWSTFTKSQPISTTSTTFVTTSARLFVPEELAGTKWNILYLAFPSIFEQCHISAEYELPQQWYSEIPISWPSCRVEPTPRVELAMRFDNQQHLYFVHSVPALHQATFTATAPIDREVEIFWRVTKGTGVLAHQLLRIDLVE